MNLKSKEFKALQAKWYTKAAKSGFEDIEKKNGQLKVFASQFPQTRLARKGPAYFEAKAEYFRRAGQFLHEHDFENHFAKQIWTLHAEGVSIREIVERLKAKGIKTHRRAVHETLQGLAKLLLEQDHE